LREKGAELEERRLDQQRLSEEELDSLIGDRDYRQFLNTKNKLYLERGMAANPPSRQEAIRLMAGEPNLIRRPIVIRGGRMVIGADKKALEELLR